MGSGAIGLYPRTSCVAPGSMRARGPGGWPPGNYQSLTESAERVRSLRGARKVRLPTEGPGRSPRRTASRCDGACACLDPIQPNSATRLCTWRWSTVGAQRKAKVTGAKHGVHEQSVQVWPQEVTSKACAAGFIAIKFCSPQCPQKGDPWIRKIRMFLSLTTRSF